MKFFLPYVIMFTFSCNYQRNVVNENDVFEVALKSDSLEFYFPETLNDPAGMKRRSPEMENFTQKWYSSALYSFKEPRLLNKSNSDATIYRLLWLRSFHPPVCFTLKDTSDKYFLNVKMLDRQPAFYSHVEGNYDNSGKLHLDTIQKADRLAFISFTEIKTMSEAEWNKFENIVDSIKFWNQSSVLPFDPGNESTDGSNWIFEAVKGGRYHFLERRNGRDGVNRLRNFLMDFTKLKVSKESIY